MIGREKEKRHTERKVIQRQGTWSDIDTGQGAQMSTGSHHRVGDVKRLYFQRFQKDHSPRTQSVVDQAYFRFRDQAVSAS